MRIIMIGIIGAMDEEVAKIVEAMEIERQEDKACMSFKAGKLNGKDVVVVRRGRVRRSKLYYLRDRVGKAAKVKEQLK